MAKGLKYLLLMLLLILGCGLFESDGKENVDDVHFSCTIVRCVSYHAYFSPSYDTTGLNIQSCSWDEEIIQILDTVIVHHTGNTADATDLCYREHVPPSYYQQHPDYPDSCFCVSGVEY